MVWQEPSFGEVHFGSACLKDARRTKRLVKVADQLMAHPGGTLPEKFMHWSDLMGAYRLFAADAVTHAAVIKPHCDRTRALMAQTGGGGGGGGGVVLRIHDTTELDYTHIPALADQLGPVGNGNAGHARGYLCHNTLAVTPDRKVLGLCAQLLRKRRRVPANESAKEKRDHPDRESRLWMAGCEASGPAPAGCTCVDVCDRGADTFEFLDYEHRQGNPYVIRCAKNRNLAGDDHVGDDRIYQKLHAYTRDLPTVGERTIDVSRQQETRRTAQRDPRVATVRIAAGPASIAVPHFARGECQSESLDLWVVHVREIDPPAAGADALEWILLTNVPADTFAAACERIDWYSCRPIIEDLHKGMKTGCNVESMQFEHADRLQPAIGVISVVAAALLQLRQVARETDADQVPATDVVPPLFVQVIAGWRYKDRNRKLSILEFFMALACLGGHLNRTHDGPPGWLTLWRGWQTLQLMILGAQAMSG
jgi:hypothetical protein